LRRIDFPLAKCVPVFPTTHNSIKTNKIQNKQQIRSEKSPQIGNNFVPPKSATLQNCRITKNAAYSRAEMKNKK